MPDGLGAFRWIALFGICAIGALLVFRRLSSTDIMALEVFTCGLVTDWQNSTAGALRDLLLYLHAGAQFLSGSPVYTTVPIDRYPQPGGYLPFLYAPPTLPIFGLLSVLPFWVVGPLWLAFSTCSILTALRLFGVPWRWAIVALLWPPIEQGLFVGNVVIPSLLLLAIAPRAGGLLGLGTLLKPQNGIIWLWLARQGTWRTGAYSLAVLACAAIVTLPLTGLSLWGEWLKGLLAYQQSQQLVPGLYGVGFGRWLPLVVFAPLAFAVVVAALIPRGREALARLGLASVMASPSLWSHGFVFAIPEFLRLRGQWFWLVIGFCAVGKWPGPQAAILMVAVGWFLGPFVRRFGERLMPASPPTSGTHPLGLASSPGDGDTL
jgi:hypothetical protein